MKRMLLVAAVLLVGAGAAHAEDKGFTYALGGGPRLGVQITMLTDELRAYFGAQKDAGVLVAKLVPGGAGEKAGVRVGDVLVSIGGVSIEDAGDVRQAFSDHKEGDTLPLTVVRDHKPVTLAVKVPKAAEPTAESWPSSPDGFQSSDFPRAGMRTFHLGDIDQRLQGIEDRLKKLEERGN